MKRAYYRPAGISEHEARSALGYVREIWLRPDRNSEPVSVVTSEAVEGHGLADDCHADAFSPRQLLIADDSAYESLSLPSGSLRENLRIGSDIQLQPGMVISVGASAVLWLTFACEVCSRLNNRRSGLMKEVGNQRGVLARVLVGGNITVGDAVNLTGAIARKWPASWRQRIAEVLSSVPDGHVVEYGHMARLAGVPRSYCRVFPRTLRDMPGVQAHKAVSSGESPERPRWSGHDLFSRSVCPPAA